MSLRRSSILKLASSAFEMDLEVLRGTLVVEADGRLTVNQRDLAEWLRDCVGQEIVLIAGSLEDEREPVVRTCRTCGRDYVEHECPHCRTARIRLRGR